jgi:hypothetical protein
MFCLFGFIVSLSFVSSTAFVGDVEVDFPHDRSVVIDDGVDVGAPLSFPRTTEGVATGWDVKDVRLQFDFTCVLRS